MGRLKMMTTRNRIPIFTWAFVHFHRVVQQCVSQVDDVDFLKK